MTSRLALATTVAAIVLGNTAGASAQTYEVTKLVPGSAFHGVHGLGIDKSGRLFAGSVAGAALYEVDRNNGTAKIAVPSPEGMSDDIAFAPDGTMAWTAFLTGDLYSRKGDGPVKKLASGLPGINSLAFRKDGRLYATQVFLGDALYEIDVEGVKPPRKIMEKMGGLNGFEFGPDDMLYGPLWFKGQVAKVDVDKAELSVVADGFKIPAAVNFDSKGNLWVVDTALGQLVRVDPKTGAKKMVAQLKPSLDNLAIDDKDRIFVSNMADNGIQEVDPETGAAKQVIIRQAGAARRHRRRLRWRQGHHLHRRRLCLPHRRRCDRRGLRTGPHARRRRDAGISDERHRQGRRCAAVELVHRHGATDRPQDRQDQGDAARLQGAARRGQARRRQHSRQRTRQQIAGPRQRRARQGPHRGDRRPRRARSASSPDRAARSI